jgi:hypothetical protein
MLAKAYMGRKRILQMLSLHAQAFLILAAAFFACVSKSVGRGYAPSFSAHVRFGEHGAPIQICRGAEIPGLLNISQEDTKFRSRSCQARHHGPLRATQKTCDLLIR